MSGIAGIAGAGHIADVAGMLGTMSHRGSSGPHVIETDGICLGAVSAPGKLPAWDTSGSADLVRDEAGPGRFARASVQSGVLALSRDRIGAAPLYVGRTSDGALCFASEAKALLPVAERLKEFPPGATHDGVRLTPLADTSAPEPSDAPPEQLARELRDRLQRAVDRCVGNGTAGAWLSGGLDSSVMVALARRRTAHLHTFSGGLRGAPDLSYAREVAEYAGTRHHEIVLTLKDLLDALPEVIASLESFDALLVRSSLVNHQVGRAAADYVDSVFSGEGGDELFAGYAYLKGIPLEALDAELRDITGRLHNTALQRVDRSAARYGLAVHTCFLDPEVVDLAFRIPVQYKIHNGVEKWILRRALDGLLPPSVLERPKAKFWEGAGVASLLADHAEGCVTDADFGTKRRLPNGWLLASKEEMMYYRIFEERFGPLQDLAWMGRTKSLPEA